MELVGTLKEHTHTHNSMNNNSFVYSVQFHEPDYVSPQSNDKKHHQFESTRNVPHICTLNVENLDCLHNCILSYMIRIYAVSFIFIFVHIHNYYVYNNVYCIQVL